MNIIVRFYWQHDLDLVALAAHPEFDTAYWIKQALIAEVRGRRDFTIPLPSSIPYSVDLESNYVFFKLYMDEDEDIIHYLNGLRTGFRNSAIKIIFRKYLENPFLDVFFNENTYRTKSRGHAASANRRRKKSLVAKTLSGNRNVPDGYLEAQDSIAQAEQAVQAADNQNKSSPATVQNVKEKPPTEVQSTPGKAGKAEEPEEEVMDLSKEKPDAEGFDLFGAIESLIN